MEIRGQAIGLGRAFLSVSESFPLVMVSLGCHVNRCPVAFKAIATMQRWKELLKEGGRRQVD
uniref:Uncharacterized protein n=1 Tax=Oryza meridionalis TaxID=40149 RepID=A0A0E0FBU7_9ORYZ